MSVVARYSKKRAWGTWVVAQEREKRERVCVCSGMLKRGAAGGNKCDWLSQSQSRFAAGGFEVHLLLHNFYS